MEIGALLREPRFLSMRVAHTDECKMTAPDVPPDDEIDLLEAKVTQLHPQHPREPYPWWCAWVCPHRTLFRGQALGMLDCECKVQVWWMVLFCKCQPFQANFLRLTPRVRTCNDVPGQETPCRALHHLELDLFPLRFCTEADLSFDETSDVMVLTGLRFQTDHFSTAHEPVDFGEFVYHFPEAPARQAHARPIRPRRPKTAPDEQASLLALHPWLHAADFEARTSKRRRSAAAIRAVVGRDAVEEDKAAPPEMAEEEEDAEPELAAEEDEGGVGAVEALALERDEWEWKEGDDHDGFYVRILGGDWLLHNRGVHSNSVGGFARAWLHRWCDACGLRKQFVRTFALYGREGAHELAREFCRRHAWFYSEWLASSAATGQMTFEREVLDGYREGATFVAWVGTLPPTSRSMAEVRLLRSLWPRTGVVIRAD